MTRIGGLAPFCAFFAVVSFFGAQVEAGSNGAPLAACETLGDPHVVFPSQPDEESPFGIFFDSDTIISGETVSLTLTLNAESNRVEGYFKGYMIIAYDHDTGDSVGTFENVLETKGQYLRCFNRAQSSVTHVNNNLKTAVYFDWRAPDDYTGKVVFKATFVENYWRFWANVPSEVLTVRTLDETSTEPETSPSTTTTSTSTSPPTASTTTTPLATSTGSTTSTTSPPTTPTTPSSAAQLATSTAIMLFSLTLIKFWSDSY